MEGSQGSGSEEWYQVADARLFGAGKPFPEHPGRAVVDVPVQAIAGGESVGVAARYLGISAISIKRWSEPEEEGVGHGVQLRWVELVPASELTLACKGPVDFRRLKSGLQAPEVGLRRPTLARWLSQRRSGTRATRGEPSGGPTLVGGGG